MVGDRGRRGGAWERGGVVRGTACLRWLLERVRRGRRYLVFGDGGLTTCRPISDGDLAEYLVGCLEDPARWDRVLPNGGPGPAITPREQGEALFGLLGWRARFRSVPVWVLDGVVGVLSAAARVRPGFAVKAALARIGRYYATESMLVWDAGAGRYEAGATPPTGTEGLVEFYRGLVEGRVVVRAGGAGGVLIRARIGEFDLGRKS